jgi:hypothetical protein
MRRCRLDAAGHIRPEHVRPLRVDHLNRSTNRQRMAASCAIRPAGVNAAAVLVDYDHRLTRDKRDTSGFVAAAYEGAPCWAEIVPAQPSAGRLPGVRAVASHLTRVARSRTGMGTATNLSAAEKGCRPNSVDTRTTRWRPRWREGSSRESSCVRRPNSPGNI